MITGASGQVSVAGVHAISGAMTNVIVDAINTTGYLGIFGLMLLEGTSLPVPSEVVLPFAGYLVSIGRLEFWLTVGTGDPAGVLGAFVDYYIGMFLGMRVISNYGSRFFISQEQMRKMESLFERHGGKIVFASRLIPGVRTLASFPARRREDEPPQVHLLHRAGLLRLRRGPGLRRGLPGFPLECRQGDRRSLELAATVIVLDCRVWLFLRFQRRQSRRPSNRSLLDRPN